MKAILGVRYGPPEVLELKDVERPTPAAGQVLLQVRAASLNAADWHGMRGGLTRVFGGGFLRPKDPRVGTDVAGVVESIGPNVTRFKPGDKVFGAAPGALAEFAVAREDRLALKPANLTFVQASAVAVAATTALQGLRDKGHIQAGQKVLVNGASGGVGTFAVQIAKSFGTEVTAVCSPGNVEQARALGADQVIDYTREDFAQNGQRYDLIYDVTARHSVSAYKRSLNPGGRCVIAGVGFPHLPMGRFLGLLIVGPLRSRFGDKSVRFMGMAHMNDKDMDVLGGLLGSGKIVSAIDRTYPLAQTGDAMRYLGTGHAHGKVVVTMGGGTPAS